MINIAELLKDAPEEIELWCTLYGKVNFISVNHNKYYPIQIRLNDNTKERLDKYGRYYNHFEGAECILFPSKEVRTWEGWKAPVEPNFKSGDWITDGVSKCQIHFIDNTQYWYSENCILGSIESVNKQYHLWTVQDAKDGDVLVLNGKPFIYSHNKYGKNYCYIDDCGQFRVNFGLVFEGNCVCPATKQERDLLFSKMREVGYEWDAEKNELRKIKPHYDISNFKPFDKVLVRDGNMEYWDADLFSSYHDEFHCFRGSWEQCIPFNKDTEHLLGTTDICDEIFINW